MGLLRGLKTYTGSSSQSLAKEHLLKTLPTYFKAIISGNKTFEIRINDREFCVGDKVFLREFSEELYTGRWVEGEIKYVTDYEQKPSYVVFGFEMVSYCTKAFPNEH